MISVHCHDNMTRAMLYSEELARTIDALYNKFVHAVIPALWSAHINLLKPSVSFSHKCCHALMVFSKFCVVVRLTVSEIKRAQTDTRTPPLRMRARVNEYESTGGHYHQHMLS